MLPRELPSPIATEIPIKKKVGASLEENPLTSKSILSSRIKREF